MLNKQVLETTFLSKAESMVTRCELQLQQKYRLNDAEILPYKVEKQDRKIRKAIRNSQIMKQEYLQYRFMDQSRLDCAQFQQTFSIATPKKSKMNFDLGILQLNNEKRQYSVVMLKQTGSQPLIQLISQLIISHLQYHVKLVNLIKLQAKTKNPSQVSNPLVIPLAGGEKIAFVFSCYQYLKNGAFYEQSEKFYIFICQDFLPFSFANIAKHITNLEFEDRLKIEGGKYGLNYYTANSLIRKSLISTLLQYLNTVQLYQYSSSRNLQTQKWCQLEWYLKDVYDHKIKIKANSKKPIQVSLFTFILYYVLKDFKVIMIGKKDTNCIMSQIVVALKACLLPISYSNPTIFAVISQMHNNYLDAPMPSIISLWGEESACEKLIAQRKQMLEYSNRYETPTVLVDMNLKLGITRNDVCQIEGLKKMDNLLKNQLNYLEQNQKENNRIKTVNSTIEKANYLVFSSLLGNQSTQLDQIAKEFKNSTIYCNYRSKC